MGGLQSTGDSNNDTKQVPKQIQVQATACLDLVDSVMRHNKNVKQLAECLQAMCPMLTTNAAQTAFLEARVCKKATNLVLNSPQAHFVSCDDTDGAHLLIHVTKHEKRNVVQSAAGIRSDSFVNNIIISRALADTANFVLKPIKHFSTNALDYVVLRANNHRVFTNVTKFMQQPHEMLSVWKQLLYSTSLLKNTYKCTHGNLIKSNIFCTVVPQDHITRFGSIGQDSVAISTHGFKILFVDFSNATLQINQKLFQVHCTQAEIAQAQSFNWPPARNNIMVFPDIFMSTLRVVLKCTTKRPPFVGMSNIDFLIAFASLMSHADFNDAMLRTKQLGLLTKIFAGDDHRVFRKRLEAGVSCPCKLLQNLKIFTNFGANLHSVFLIE